MAKNPIGYIGLDDGEFNARFCRPGVNIFDARPLDLTWSDKNRTLWLAEEMIVTVPYGNIIWNDFYFSRSYPGVPIVLHTAHLSGDSQSKACAAQLTNTGYILLAGCVVIVYHDRISIRQMSINPQCFFGISVFWYEALL